MGQALGEDHCRSRRTGVILHGGAHALFPGRTADIRRPGVGAAVVEMGLVRAAQKGSSAHAGLYRLQLPDDAGKPGEDLLSSRLVTHGVGLLGRAHHMRHCPAGRRLPAGGADAHEGVFAAKRVALFEVERLFREDFREDAGDGGVVEQVLQGAFVSLPAPA